MVTAAIILKHNHKYEVVKEIGNAVCPLQAKALVKAVLG
jgi:site-specific DNA-cytosine methylase